MHIVVCRSFYGERVYKDDDSHDVTINFANLAFKCAENVPMV